MLRVDVCVFLNIFLFVDRLFFSEIFYGKEDLGWGGRKEIGLLGKMVDVWVI